MDAFEWGLIALAALIAVMASSCTMVINAQDNDAIVRMVVQKGADPLAAKCAIRANGSDCAIAALQRK